MGPPTTPPRGNIKKGKVTMRFAAQSLKLLIGLCLANICFTCPPIRKDIYKSTTLGSINMNGTVIKGMSISALNVNSLNMANINKPIQLRKLLGIVKLRTDIILLSDLRLSNRNNVNSKNDLIYHLLNNEYESYNAILHSNKNKRGVGILIKSSISFTEVEVKRDEDEDYLLAKLRFQSGCLIVGSVYGPNNHNQQFFFKHGA
jgi:hypothetical protein